MVLHDDKWKRKATRAYLTRHPEARTWSHGSPAAGRSAGNQRIEQSNTGLRKEQPDGEDIDQKSASKNYGEGRGEVGSEGAEYVDEAPQDEDDSLQDEEDRWKRPIIDNSERYKEDIDEGRDSENAIATAVDDADMRVIRPILQDHAIEGLRKETAQQQLKRENIGRALSGSASRERLAAHASPSEKSETQQLRYNQMNTFQARNSRPARYRSKGLVSVVEQQEVEELLLRAKQEKNRAEIRDRLQKMRLQGEISNKREFLVAPEDPDAFITGLGESANEPGEQLQNTAVNNTLNAATGSQRQRPSQHSDRSSKVTGMGGQWKSDQKFLDDLL